MTTAPCGHNGREGGVGKVVMRKVDQGARAEKVGMAESRDAQAAHPARARTLDSNCAKRSVSQSVCCAMAATHSLCTLRK